MTQIEDIKDNTNLIPFLGAYFILYGSVDLITFYREFNISIIHFINFSEIIFYFIRDLYIIIAHVILLFIAVIGFTYFKQKAVGNLETQIPQWREDGKKIRDILATIDKDNLKQEDERKIKEAENLTNRISEEVSSAEKRTKRIRILLLLAGLLIVGQLLWLTYEFGWQSGLRFIAPVFISFGIGFFVRDFRIFMVIYGLVSLLTSAYFNAISNANKVKNGSNYGIDVEIDGKLIQSDSSNFVIGKTEKYLFFYESKLKRTTAYPADKMNYMTIPNR